MNLLTKIWYPKHPLFCLLVLFSGISGIYRLALFLKKLSYRFGLKKITHFPVPIIVIGNLTVGGTGKTPLIIALSNFLLEKGYKPGIVSRGYGGKPKKLPLHVYPNSDPKQAGDEPVLIARRTSCPVVVDSNRVRAVQTLLSTYNCDLVLSDDGLQHLALGRDIEIIVIDGIRRFGNHFCLPLGPLREPTTRLKSVDFIVTRGGTPLPGEWPMRLRAAKPVNLVKPELLFSSTLFFQTIHAVAGIGNPSVFFDQLRTMGFSIIEHPFPDHHDYKPKDIDFGPNAIVIMTEKDAVKCLPFAREQQWYLPVFADCGSMTEQLLKQLKKRNFLPVKDKEGVSPQAS